MPVSAVSFFTADIIMQKANPGTSRKKAKSNNKAAPLLIIPWFYNTSSSRQEGLEGFPMDEQHLVCFTVITRLGFERVWCLCWEALGSLSHLPKAGAGETFLNQYHDTR